MGNKAVFPGVLYSPFSTRNFRGWMVGCCNRRNKPAGLSRSTTGKPNPLEEGKSQRPQGTKVVLGEGTPASPPPAPHSGCACATVPLSIRFRARNARNPLIARSPDTAVPRARTQIRWRPSSRGPRALGNGPVAMEARDELSSSALPAAFRSLPSPATPATLDTPHLRNGPTRPWKSN